VRDAAVRLVFRHKHGEVFVLDDGGEVDLDLGNYERFIGITLTKDHNITTGKIFQAVIEKEREGAFLGKTVQVVPHLTDAIQDWIERVAHIPVDGSGQTPDVCIIELGGTVGDIESGPFLEALRQFQFRHKAHDVCSVHVSLVPVLGVVGEQKTKPTQHSVQVLRSVGISPNFLACRSKEPLEESTKEKLALFCHVPPTHVMNLSDVSNIWHVPLVMRDQGVHKAICEQLQITPPHALDIERWEERALRWDSLQDTVTIAVIGKYTGLTDSYLSVMKSLQHAAIAANRKLKITWVEASDLEEPMKETSLQKYQTAWKAVEDCDGILVPGGFGGRGTEGKAACCKYARETKKPFFGICLGMQVACIEFARNVLGMEGANSTEIDPATPHPVVVFMPEGSTTHMGGTMRLGSRRTFLQEAQCLSALLYQKMEYIDERHRHRYEVNPEMIHLFEEKGFKFVGKDETGRRMEIIELKGHPFYVACQFHPEYKSRPGKPSALFLGLILAASKQLHHYMSGYESEA